MGNKIRRKRRNREYGFTAAILIALLCMVALSVRALESGNSPAAPSLASWETASPEPSSEGPVLEPSSSASQGETGSFLLDAPFISQEENWPTGCESVCAVMALQYAGVDITVDDFIDGYLPLGNAPYEVDGVLFGCDPCRAFPGDPRSDWGWGCYAPVILEATEQLLREREVSSLSIADLSGQSLESLCEEYVAEGVPVMVWATIDMEEPEEDTVFLIEDTGEEFLWIYPMHCLLLVGWDDGGYLFNDPLAGKAVHYERPAVERAYKGLGSQALALLPEWRRSNEK